MAWKGGSKKHGRKHAFRPTVFHGTLRGVYGVDLEGGKKRNDACEMLERHIAVTLREDARRGGRVINRIVEATTAGMVLINRQGGRVGETEINVKMSP